MFSKLVSRNSKRNRKENGLFFASLLVAIVAFYIILSLSNQDVMIFLKKMESDAVNKLMMMIPLFYGMTLVILFSLIYFASKFQLERRRHEFGVYLMMGMRRVRLFFMLLAEDLRSSVLALLIGLPIAVLMSELISLITARLVGLGIIGHRFAISPGAIVWTAVGFLLIKLLAFLILSGKIASQEIGKLLVETPEAEKKQRPAIVYAGALCIGILCLVIAYAMAINGLSWGSLPKMGITLILGLSGTFLFFFGLRFVMGRLANSRKGKRGLQTFTFRQLQEHVIFQSNVLAVSSLLILAALCCFGAGVAMALHYSGSEQHTLDYTFLDSTADQVTKTLEKKGLDEAFAQVFDMRVGYIRTTEDYDHAVRLDTVMDAVRQQPDTTERGVLLNQLGYSSYPHIMPVSDYNKLLAVAGKPEINLKAGEAAVYMDDQFTWDTITEMLNQILAEKPEITICDSVYHLTGTVQSTSLVTDRSITLSFSLILPDDEFAYFTTGHYDTYVDAVLDPAQVKDESLMNAIAETNDKLSGTGLSYESYLQNMGRQLFYVVAASYVTIYLAIIFLIIANTVIGVQFLTSQQKNGRRYQTLIRLGATYETVCTSAGKQIRWYFGIPIVVAALSSIFGVWALLTGILSYGMQQTLSSMLFLSAAMILLLCVVEYIYMSAVKRASSRTILKLMVPEREE
ncbi:MAG: ABC transporter permease [Lachnospiraceae bacterium]|nr:ABC transporter permease [Lachnospiraceae bacterium]